MLELVGVKRRDRKRLNRLAAMGQSGYEEMQSAANTSCSTFNRSRFLRRKFSCSGSFCQSLR
jgi:hypothetical protein